MTGLRDIQIGEPFLFVSRSGNEYAGVKLYQGHDDLSDGLCLIEFGGGERGIGNRVLRNPNSGGWLCLGKEIDKETFLRLDCHHINYYNFCGETKKIKEIFAIAKRIWNDDFSTRSSVMRMA